jgi:hypothetical protein
MLIESRIEDLIHHDAPPSCRHILFLVSFVYFATTPTKFTKDSRLEGLFLGSVSQKIGDDNRRRRFPFQSNAGYGVHGARKLGGVGQ